MPGSRQEKTMDKLMFLAIALLVCVCLVPVAIAQENPAKDDVRNKPPALSPDEEAKVKEFLKQLDDDSPEIRDKAQKEIEDIGPKAEALVRPALQAESAEVRSRAGTILALFDLMTRAKLSDSLLKKFPNAYKTLAGSDTAEKIRILNEVTAKVGDSELFMCQQDVTENDVSTIVDRVLSSEDANLGPEAKTLIFNAYKMGGRIGIKGIRKHLVSCVPYRDIFLMAISVDTERLLATQSCRDVIPDIAALLKDTKPKDITERSTILELLVKLNAKEAIPAILSLLTENKDDRFFVFSRGKAMTALARLGSREAAPCAMKMLTDNDMPGDAAETLGCLDVKEAVPGLIKVLREEKADYLRRDIAYALYQLGAKEEALPELLGLLKNGDTATFKINSHVERLGELGVKEAIPGILEVMDEARAPFFVAPLIKLDAKETVPALTKMLDSGNFMAKMMVSEVLEKLGGKEAIPKLVAILKDTNASQSLGMAPGRAACALAALGAKEHVPDILAALKINMNLLARLEMAEALAELGAREESLKALTGLLKGMAPYKEDAAFILGHIGAVEAGAGVKALLQDKIMHARYAGACTVGALGLKDAIPEVRKLLQDDWTLPRVGDKDSVPAIVELMNNSDPYSAAVCAVSLTELGAKDKIPGRLVEEIEILLMGCLKTDKPGSQSLVNYEAQADRDYAPRVEAALKALGVSEEEIAALKGKK
jgi:HEAT repeat protein